MSYRLNTLDKNPIGEGETAAAALSRTLRLVQQAEEWGYHRFWIAKHHNAPQLASPSPELVIARVLGQTQHIRVGSGGVILQHYSPYKVAESFSLLASLAPGRADLGVEKAPGDLPLSTQALQHGLHQEEKGSFADQLSLLNDWLALSGTESGETVFPTPIPPIPPEKFVLGVSVQSAQLAAQSDWNLVFTVYLNGDKALLHDVLSFWQIHSARPTIVAVQVIVVDSYDTTAQLAENVQLQGVELEDGQRVTVASEEQALAFAAQSGSPPRKITRCEQALLHGTAQKVMAKLNVLHMQFGIDGFIIDTPVTQGHTRLISLHLLAQAHSAVGVL